MKKTVTLVIVISIFFLIITILKDGLILDKELRYENKQTYPISVDPTEHDSLYDEEFKEDELYHLRL